MSDIFFEMTGQPVRQLIDNLTTLLSPKSENDLRDNLTLVKHSEQLNISQKIYLSTSIAKSHCSKHLVNALAGLEGKETTEYKIVLENIRQKFVGDTIRDFLAHSGIFDA